MVLDVTIIIIMLLFAIYGFRKGFVFTLIHTFGWALALGGSYLLVSYAEDFLRKYTTLYSWILAGYRERFDSGDLNTTDALSGLPGDLSTGIDDTVHTATDALARTFADMTFTVIVFACLFVLIKIVIWLLLRLLSKNHRDGFTGFIDGFFGMLFSLLKGAVLVFLLLAIMMPLADFFAPDLAISLAAQLDSSYFTKILYDNNIIIIIAENFFGASF